MTNQTETPPGKPMARWQLHPLLVVVAMMVFAMALTYVLPAGHYDRHDRQVVAGSYQPIEKVGGLTALVSPGIPQSTDQPARAAGFTALLTAMPAGMIKASGLIFMLLFVGGTFGILRATGALEAGIDRMLHLTSGNIYLLTIGLIVFLSCGSSFLGFSSEYVAIVPVVLAVGRRLSLPNMFAAAVVAGADIIGIGVSVTGPIVLGVVQPLAGLPVFSGIPARLAIFAVLLTILIVYVLLFLRRVPKVEYTANPQHLTLRQAGVLVSLVCCGAALVAGTALWSWENRELSAAFLALGLVMAIVGGLRPRDAADAFLKGMEVMILPCVLIGGAGGAGILLESSQVIDSIVSAIASILSGHTGAAVAMGLMLAEMAFGVLMPSVTAKAAVSMPILAPIAHLAGVDSHVIVTALLLGSGMTNLVAPTNPLLLAFLAAAQTSYLEWIRFIWPFFLIATAVSLTAICLMAL
jgi:uncharacterized ion transporter superfamily protein YfcC